MHIQSIEDVKRMEKENASKLLAFFFLFEIINIKLNICFKFYN